MEAFEAKSQLDNQQKHTGLPLQSDQSINNDELVHVLAKELENLVISCKNEYFDRDLQVNSVVIDKKDHVNQAIDEELRHLVVKEDVIDEFQAESSNGNGENNYRDVKQFLDDSIERNALNKVIGEDRKEYRVSEERKAGESGIGCEKQEEKVDDCDNENVLEHDQKDLKENHEIEIIDGDRSGEIGGYHYPLRPDAEDCSYYMRTGMCKYGSNCKFNHPLRRRNQQLTKETKKQKEENLERPGQQIECKYYSSSAGCKHGKACKFTHTRVKTVITPVVDYNFLGLPIRPGEKECPYYMRNGSCKYGPKCRFNHPGPTGVAGGDVAATYGNDGPIPLPNAPQPNLPSWSAPRTLEPAAAFVPMMYSPTQTMDPPNPDWNGYQAPGHLYPSSDRAGLPIPPAFFLNNPPTDTNFYTHHHQPQMFFSDYPERPGQPDCSYFMKTGDCKYKTGCKFHHPNNRITKTTPSVLSDKGLPLRPDQNICTHYSRYGICKYGPACKYDHPVNYSNSIPTGEGYRPSRSNDPLIQQSV